MRNTAYLLQLPLHPRHQHNTGDAHSQQQEEGVDETSHRGIISTGAASTQQAGGAAAQARDLHKHITKSALMTSLFQICSLVRWTDTLTDTFDTSVFAKSVVLKCMLQTEHVDVDVVDVVVYLLVMSQ